MLNSKGEVKLSDFGISRVLDGTAAMSNTAVGSFHYMSPERLLGEPYGVPGDVWSVGIMLIQLRLKVYPFKEGITTPIDLSEELENLELDKYLQSQKFSPLLSEVIRAMLAHDPGSRLTCIQLIELPWFQNYKIFNIIDAQKVFENLLQLSNDLCYKFIDKLLFTVDEYD